jgi:hypothetical protein
MHIHHRLIRFGMTPGRAVRVILSATLCAAAQSYALFVQGTLSALAVTGLAALFVLFSISDQRRRNASATEASFREILFYLLGAQNGPNPRWDGQVAIGEVLAAPREVETAARASALAIADGSPPAPERARTPAVAPSTVQERVAVRA